jgi:hypothetical protein
MYCCKTQNTNEVLHSIIWEKLPKDNFVSKYKIYISVTKTVFVLNQGYYMIELARTPRSSKMCMVKEDGEIQW